MAGALDLQAAGPPRRAAREAGGGRSRGMSGGIPRDRWAWWCWIGEHGAAVERQTRRERAEQGLPARVEMMFSAS